MTFESGLRLRLLGRDLQAILQSVLNNSSVPRLAEAVLVSHVPDALVVDLAGFNILAIWPEAPAPVRWVAPSQVRILVCGSLETANSIRISWSVQGGLGLLQLLQFTGLMKRYMNAVNALDGVERYAFIFSLERLPEPWREVASRWSLSEFALPAPCGAALHAVAIPS